MKITNKDYSKSINVLHKRKSISGLHKRKSINGFTIVELVIVIAVIAILAGVLIPTFSSVIIKAKHSAIKENARNRYTEYFIEYGEDPNFINDVIIKHKEVDCIIFIDGQMINEVYSLDKATEEVKNKFNNQELKIYPNEKYKDVLMITEETSNNISSENIIGFSPITSINSLQPNESIIILNQYDNLFPDFTYVGLYNNESKSYLGTNDLYEATHFILEKIDNDDMYWLIKDKETNKYLYMDFSQTEAGEYHIYLGEYNQNNIDDFLWEINIINNETVIKTKKTYSDGYPYFLTYYQEDNQFRCHFGVKYPIKIYQLLFITIE